MDDAHVYAWMERSHMVHACFDWYIHVYIRTCTNTLTHIHMEMLLNGNMILAITNKLTYINQWPNQRLPDFFHLYIRVLMIYFTHPKYVASLPEIMMPSPNGSHQGFVLVIPDCQFITDICKNCMVILKDFWEKRIFKELFKLSANSLVTF